MLERNRYLRVLLEGELIFTLVPIVILYIGFTMLFWLVPSAQVRLTSAMIGAFVTTLLFSLVRWGFSIYAAHLMSGQLNLIYGTVGLAWANAEPRYLLAGLVATTILVLVDGIHAHN